MIKSKKTKILAFFIATLFISGAALASYWYATRHKVVSSVDTKKTEETTKSDTEKKDAETAKSSENNNSKQATQEQSTAQAGTANVSISSAGVSGQSLYVNALVSGATSGTCKLVLSNGSVKIEKTASVGLQVSYYICQGFSVPLNEIVPKGEWNALIELSSPNGYAQSEIKKVTVQ